MKKLIYGAVSLAMIVGITACKMELEPYNQNTNRIAFVFKRGVDSVARYTFAYSTAEVTQDTVWVEAQAIGYLYNQPRKVTISQRTVANVHNAEKGKHFVSFDDAVVSRMYVIPADSTGVKLPIIIKRDPSLKTSEYVLEFSLNANADFGLGAPKDIVKRIVISDILTKPNTWGSQANYYIGTYGTEKHKVMIEAAAPYGVKINDQWIDDVVNHGEYGYMSYWVSIFKTKLQEINAARKEAKLDPLTEGSEYGNVRVKFNL